MFKQKVCNDDIKTRGLEFKNYKFDYTFFIYIYEKRFRSF
jgi:hypothetical protein